MVDQIYRPAQTSFRNDAEFMNPFNWLRRHSPIRTNAEKLYGAIVAQARLPIFYASIGMPDTLEGRLSTLTIHLFVLLRRMRSEGPEGEKIAQELVDLFSADMDTVLREMGVSDLKVPKRVRDLCAKTHGVINTLEASLDSGPEALRRSLSELLPLTADDAEAASQALSTYLQETMESLAEQDFTALRHGTIHFPEVPHVEDS